MSVDKWLICTFSKCYFLIGFLTNRSVGLTMDNFRRRLHLFSVQINSFGLVLMFELRITDSYTSICTDPSLRMKSSFKVVHDLLVAKQLNYRLRANSTQGFYTLGWKWEPTFVLLWKIWKYLLQLSSSEWSNQV
jgi:hypothetical protein